MIKRQVNRQKRSIFQTLKLRHQNNIRTKLYPFLIKNVIKMLIGLGLVVVGIIILDKFLDLEMILKNLIQQHSKGYVLAIFLVSESILGWIPPDLFIAWAEQFEYKFLYLALLATISYIGGINAYFIGKWLYKFPKIHNYVTLQNELFFKRIKKWGGFLVVFAALFPLPYATTATVAGMVHYSFKKFLLYGTTRYLRFFIYAQAIYYFMKIVEGV